MHLLSFSGSKLSLNLISYLLTWSRKLHSVNWHQGKLVYHVKLIKNISLTRNQFKTESDHPWCQGNPPNMFRMQQQKSDRLFNDSWRWRLKEPEWLCWTGWERYPWSPVEGESTRGMHYCGIDHSGITISRDEQKGRSHSLWLYLVWPPLRHWEREVKFHFFRRSFLTACILFLSF